MSELSEIKQHLRRLIEAEGKEDQEEAEELMPFTGKTVEGNDSLDIQLDRFIREYEVQAIGKKEEEIFQSEYGQRLENITRNFINRRLFEAPEDDQPEDDETPAEKGADILALDPDAPEKPQGPPIDVRVYADSIANLVNNAMSLLETKNTILRRAINHLGKTYDKNVTRQLEIILEDEHGLAINKSEKDIEEERFPAPLAGGAGPLE